MSTLPFFQPKVFEDYFNQPYLNTLYKEKIHKRSTPGIDGTNRTNFWGSIDSNTYVIKKKVLIETYNFSPYLEVIRAKGRGKLPRIISKSTLRDKLVLSALKNFLHDKYKNNIGRLIPNEYVRKITTMLEKPSSKDIYFVKLDIKSFYDEIDRDILINRLTEDGLDIRALTLIKSSISNITVPSNYKFKHAEKYMHNKGIPQGLPISNILANIYIDTLDDYYEKYDGDVQYYRYVDDILLISPEESPEMLKDHCEKVIKSLNLQFNDKEEKGVLSDGFDFLGYHIKGNSISVRESSADKFMRSIVGLFTQFKRASESKVKKHEWLTESMRKEIFILNLNEKITGAVSENKRFGWIFYFIEINDLKLLKQIDNLISKQFKRLDSFNNKKGKHLKSIFRAYHEARYNPESSYYHNYNQYQDYRQKLNYLIKYGHIDKNKDTTFSEQDIETLFDRYKMSHLMHLEEDVGTLS